MTVALRPACADYDRTAEPGNWNARRIRGPVVLRCTLARTINASLVEFFISLFCLIANQRLSARLLSKLCRPRIQGSNMRPGRFGWAPSLGLAVIAVNLTFLG